MVSVYYFNEFVETSVNILLENPCEVMKKELHHFRNILDAAICYIYRTGKICYLYDKISYK